MTRRSVVLLAAALAVGASLDAGPATAAPAVAGCTSRVSGVTSDNRLVVTNVDDGQVGVAAKSPPLDFTPAHMAFDHFEGDDLGITYGDWASGTDGSLRRVRLRVPDQSEDPGPPTVSDQRVDLGFSLLPRLLTISGYDVAGGYGQPEFLYRVSASGSLYRDALITDAGGTTRLGATVSLGRDLVNARTLTVHRRITLDGERADVLFGTTTYGRLFELTVPTAHPARRRTTVLATSGFAAYDGLAAHQDGRCDDGAETEDHVLVRADSATGSGRSYAMRTVHHPRRTDLVPGAVITEGLDLTALH